MRIGIHTVATDETISPTKLGPALEERGFDALFLADHSHIPVHQDNPYPRGGELPRMYRRAFDPFIALAGTAGVTTKLLLGTGIALIVQRDPIQVAKEVATLDHLSGGRAVLGIGAGWSHGEMRDHGTDPRTRGALLDERMAAIIAIWTNDEAEFHGRFVDFDPMWSWPKPVRRPHPPIYVGGDSDRAVARANRFGGWLPSGSGVEPDAVAALLARVEVPVIANAIRPDRELVAAYREAGAAGVTFHLPQLGDADALRTLDEWAGLIG